MSGGRRFEVIVLAIVRPCTHGIICLSSCGLGARLMALRVWMGIPEDGHSCPLRKEDDCLSVRERKHWKPNQAAL